MHCHQFLKFILILTSLFLLNHRYSLAENYYWIGGNGNWSDINNWAKNSGGTVLHIQIPNSDDDVFFDQNSFSENNQVVTVNTENAICRSMDWTGALFYPTFSGTTNNNIRLYGSLILCENLIQNFNGTFTFQGTTTGNLISSANHIFKNHIIFDGVEGTWQLTNEMLVNGNIYLTNGHFLSSNYNITCNSFLSTQTAERGLEITNSILFLKNGWHVMGSNFQLEAANSQIIIQNGNLNNADGDTLNFWNLNMMATSTVSSSDIYSTFNKITYKNGGTLEGNLEADTVNFEEGGASSSVLNNTNINFLSQFCTFNYISGNNTIQTVEARNNNFTSGNNVIDLMIVEGNARIEENNIIDKISIQDTGVVIGQNTIAEITFGKTSYIRGTNYLGLCYFNSDGYLYGNNTFNTLTFSPGFRYFLENNSTQVIESEFHIIGNCQAPIFIKSLYNGIEAIIHKTNGNINGEYLSLRDIHISGANATASNSVNLGNNNGWVIEESTPLDLYWVNGSGNWNDMNHWSLSSGGTAGECPPREIDNVIVDASSLSTNDSIYINVKNAVCNTFNWENNQQSIFSGPDTNFHKIYGSLYFSDQIQNNFKGETHFEATTDGQVIDSHSKPFLNTIRIQGKNGEWTLEDKLQSTDTLFFEHGSFHTNNNNIYTRVFSSADTTDRSFYLYEDTVTLNGFNLCWTLNGQNITLDADSSVIVFTEEHGSMLNQDHERLIFNNVHFKEVSSVMENNAYCVYNLITFDKEYGKITEDCTIDTVIFYSDFGNVRNSDTIKTAIFHGDYGALDGNHVVEIAYFFGLGNIIGQNKVDTALFYNKGNIIRHNIIDTAIIFDNAFIEGQNEIRTATLKNNGDFLGNNIFDDLFLEFSKVYQFGHDSVQTINNKLSANGRCTGPIFLVSDLHGSEAIIKKLDGEVIIDYANIRDIKAEGPMIPFTANNSIDLGGNSNWEIVQQETKALYWVGNTGNWSDSLHWSYESGGEPGYCIPSPVDNVVFDNNSFSSPSEVYVDVVIATCLDMVWEGSEFNPQFQSITDIPDQSLYIYGSLIFIDEMENNFDGKVYFATNEEDQFIISANNSFINDVIYEGENGSWNLLDSLSVLGTIELRKGTIITHGQNVSGLDFISMDTTNRSLILDTTTFTVENWNIYSKNFNLKAGTSKIIAYDSVNSLGTGNSDILQYNDVVFKSSGILWQENIYCRYDDVTYKSSGKLLGNCTIDTLLFEMSGIVSGKDSINYAYYNEDGVLNGFQSIINTSIFNGSGLISGECAVASSIFNSYGQITGNNSIDTTIFYGSGNIQGQNLFGSQVTIYGNGSIVGENSIQKNLVIHGVASIFDNNQIHNALLLDWGYIGGSNVFDILSFTPGKTYTLTATTSQTVSDTLNILGNNCFPINLISSSSNSVQAEINMPNGCVSGDFINMKDIAITGNAQFFAGGHSDNINNNTGWIWENSPGYIYGLGEDLQFLCEGESLELSTANFNGNENTIYEWSDGSISPTYEVNEPGVYGVTVHYSEECSVTGHVTVENLPTPQIDLGEDTEICEGEILELNSVNDFESYLWNNGSLESSIIIDSSGIYWLEVTNDVSCSKRDSIILDVMDAPQINLGNDVTIHKGEYVSLDAGYPGGVYEWSTGETAQTINAHGLEMGNIYWVEVFYESCYGIDSITIGQYPYCTASVPTAFSPNGDGLNDTLKVFGSGIQSLTFQVFNRYGELVFESNRMQDGWDGKIKGIKQEIDVLTFYLKATCFDGIVTEKKGNITLLR